MRRNNVVYEERLRTVQKRSSVEVDGGGKKWEAMNILDYVIQLV